MRFLRTDGSSGAMAENGETKERRCSGENYAVSRAICRTRQRNQYPKCLLCEHRDEELGGSSASDTKVSNAIFRSTAVLGRVPEQLNEYVMRKVGLATAQFLRAEDPSASRLVVGCDLRENSRGFARIFCEGVNRSGADAISLGTAPRDLLAFTLGTDSCAGAAFVSGWNCPDNVNGVRVWRSDGRLVGFGDGLDRVGLIARRLRMARSRLPGQTTGANPLPEYVAYVRKFAGQLNGLKIVADAGHGAASRILNPLCQKLPLELAPLNFESDPHSPFLGRRFPCRPAAGEVKRRVRETEADFGCAFDFAAGRIAFFDERGEQLRHDVAAGLIATELLARNPGACVVYDLRATAALRARIGERDGQPVAAPASPLQFARHFRRNEALYGADMTGLHYFSNFFGFPSAFVALLLFASHLGREGRPVGELAAELDTLERSDDITIDLPSADVADEVLQFVRDEFPQADRDMIDGLTVRLPDWWFNLRQPGGASELRLTVEARERRRVRRGRQTVQRAVDQALSAVKS
ncbi:MAG: hypothetical protein ACOC7T_05020 [Planctomycetota bacterium]